MALDRCRTYNTLRRHRPYLMAIEVRIHNPRCSVHIETIKL